MIPRCGRMCEPVGMAQTVCALPPADEKSQIQALDRTQPGLPLKPGKCGTMTHDYKRNGTTTLFAALNILDRTVIGRCMGGLLLRHHTPSNPTRSLPFRRRSTERDHTLHRRPQQRLSAVPMDHFRQSDLRKTRPDPCTFCLSQCTSRSWTVSWGCAFSAERFSTAAMRRYR
jgi:hypothetical protein